MDVPRTLLITNDYAPRVGGIQRTLEALVRQLPRDRVAVLCPNHEGAAAFDDEAPYRVFRQPERFLWPTSEVRQRVHDAVREFEAEVVLFGATYPLALLGPSLARSGTPYVAAAHGFEYWLSISPGAHALVRRATARAAWVPVMCSRFVARVVRTAVPDPVPVTVLYPGADVEAFRPDLPTADIRARHGLVGRPLIVCVSRLVPRKGQDVLIRAMSRIRGQVPDPALLIVGDGPYRPKLERLAVRAPEGSVVFAGQVPEEDLPRYYRVGDVFAMPCRNRFGGLEVEGWGNVFIEAAACGRAVVVGDSGGASETVVPGATGVLVEGSDDRAVADAVASLLVDPARAEAMGVAGRERVERHFPWPRAAAQLAEGLRRAVLLLWPAPGDLLHLDTKKLGRIDGVGKRFGGPRRSRAIGWNYLHVAIDDHSRLAYAEELADEVGTTATAFTLRAIEFFGSYGIRVRRVLTDNGSCYRSLVFRDTLASVDIQPLRTRPYTPRTNGKAEAMVGVLLRGWAYRRPYDSSAERIAALGSFIHTYNHHRPHGGLDGARPIDWVRQ